MNKRLVPLIKPIKLPCRIGNCQGYLIEDKNVSSKLAYTLQCDTCHGYAYIPKAMAERLEKEKKGV